MSQFFKTSPGWLSGNNWKYLPLVKTYKKFGLVAKIGVGTFVCLIYMQNVNFNLWGNRAFYQLWHFHTNFSLLFIAKLYAAHYSLLPHHTIHPFCVNPNKLTPFVVIKTNPNKTLSAVTLPNLLANGLENKKNEIKTYGNYL